MDLNWPPFCTICHDWDCETFLLVKMLTAIGAHVVYMYEPSFVDVTVPSFTKIR
jgi:hypothetical protein